jgi:hypothetical protein
MVYLQASAELKDKEWSGRAIDKVYEHKRDIDRSEKIRK